MKTKLKKDFSDENFKELTEILDLFENNVKNSGITFMQIEMLLKIIFKINVLTEKQNQTQPNLAIKCLKIMENVISKLLFLEEKTKNIFKYAIILEKECFEIPGPLNRSYNKIKIMLAHCYINYGILKNIEGEFIFRNNSNLSMEEEEKDKVDEMIKNDKSNPDFDLLKNYLGNLTRKINMALEPIPERLDSFEKAISILTSIIPKINKDCYDFLEAKIELARSKRYLAISKKQMTNEIWG